MDTSRGISALAQSIDSLTCWGQDGRDNGGGDDDGGRGGPVSVGFAPGSMSTEAGLGWRAVVGLCVQTAMESGDVLNMYNIIVITSTKIHPIFVS